MTLSHSFNLELGSDFDQIIPARFASIAKSHSHRVAVAFDGTTITYQALAASVGTLGAALVSAGASPLHRVALLLPDEASMIVGWLGTLQSGAVCVPLTSEQPAERLRAIVEDADASILVTNTRYLDLARKIARPRVKVLNLDEVPPLAQPEYQPPAVTSDCPAYLLYTSGATGKPKGVVQTHRNLLRNVCNLSELMHISVEDRLVGLMPFSIGQGVATLFVALLNGATLHPYLLKQEGLATLASWLNENKITAYTSAVTVFRQFARSLPENTAFPHLRVLRLGAEELRPADVQLYQEKFPRQCRLINCLGSTETMNYARQVIDHDTVIHGKTVPVGLPPEGTVLSLVDTHGNEVPADETGEILVRTRFLSPGYWRDPELTGRKFQEAGDGLRTYRTGDRARRRPDATLEYLGRVDHQVKIRGNRIELAEIEHALHSHPQITEAVASVRRDPDTGAEAVLVAHVQTALPEAEIRAFLIEKLPKYMIPTVFLRLELLPLALSGKVDRHGLPMPVDWRQPRPASELLSPRTEMEAAMARCWSRVLERTDIDVHEDFMSLGGGSLKALQLFADIRTHMGMTFAAGDVLGGFTVAEMAAKAGSKEVVNPPTLRSARVSTSFLVRIRGKGETDPVFIIPGGWGGDNEVLLFADLSLDLNTDRPIFAARSRALDPTWTGISSLANQAAAIFHEMQPHIARGRWILMGECVACPLAMEIARLAGECGLTPTKMVLLDPWMPREAGIFTRMKGWWQNLRRPKGSQDLSADPLPERISLYYKMLKSALPRPINGDLHLVVSSDKKSPRRVMKYWRQFTRGKICPHKVQGTHDSYVREDAAGTVEVLNRVLFE